MVPRSYVSVMVKTLRSNLDEVEKSLDTKKKKTRRANMAFVMSEVEKEDLEKHTSTLTAGLEESNKKIMGK